MTTVRNTGRLDNVGRPHYAASTAVAPKEEAVRAPTAADGFSVRSSYNAYGASGQTTANRLNRDGASAAPPETDMGPIAGGRPKPPPVLGAKDGEKDTVLAGARPDGSGGGTGPCTADPPDCSLA